MDAELKVTEMNINVLREAMRLGIKTIQLFRGSEDTLLDTLEKTFAKYYKSSDEKYRETMLIMALEMGIAWNNAVDELGDSTFHKDALAKRFLKIIWEE